jgi:hypothetical protein
LNPACGRIKEIINRQADIDRKGGRQMIIKFQSGKKWVVFGSIEQLEYQVLGNGPSGGQSGISVYEPSAESIRSAEKYVELIFSQGKGEGMIVHAYSPIYLMNDEGKTIEII